MIKAVRLDPASLIPVIILLLFNPPEYVGVMLLCAVLHESGHLAAMKLVGVKAEKISIMLMGADIKMSGMCGYGGDMIIYSSGAVANLAGAVCGYGIYVAFPSTVVMFFIISNLFYALFNMLPIRGLDGGGFAEALFMKYCEPYTAQKICDLTSAFAMALLFAFSVWTMSASGLNFSLLFIALYLFVGLAKKQT